MATVLLVIFSIGLMAAIILAIVDVKSEVYPNVKTQRKARVIKSRLIIFIAADLTVVLGLIVVNTLLRVS